MDNVHPHASYCNQVSNAVLQMNELEKKRAYEEWEREVEHGSFAHEHYTIYITHLSILVLGGWVTLVQLPCCVWYNLRKLYKCHQSQINARKLYK